MVDLNGVNRIPNKLGYDRFIFQYVDGSFVPIGAEGTFVVDLKGEAFCVLGAQNAAKSDNGLTCGVQALMDPDYFKKVVKIYRIY